jgi:alpha-glucuronidase
MGIGFNRTTTGSNAIAQYFPEARKLWEDLSTCEEKNLLWFHHVSWNHKMKSNRTLWEELCYHYYTGTERVKAMHLQWTALKPYVDKERFEQVSMLLRVQHEEAVWWRNACLLYFQTFHKMPIPAGYEKPDKSLDDYKRLRFPFAPQLNRK